MNNVTHISQLPGWQRVLLVELSENDLIEITLALKHRHDELKERGKRTPITDWPEVRKSLRDIIAKCYSARGVEDNDQVSE